MTWIEVLWGLFTMAVSVGGSWLVAWRMIIASRASNAHASAVTQLLPSLLQLHELVRLSPSAETEPESVEAALVEFEQLCLQHEAALPRALQSLRRNVRAAVGNYFGGAALAFLRDGTHEAVALAPHPYWREVSLSYIKHVIDQLSQSLTGGNQPKLRDFNDWRREDDAELERTNHLAMSANDPKSTPEDSPVGKDE